MHKRAFPSFLGVKKDAFPSEFSEIGANKIGGIGFLFRFFVIFVRKPPIEVQKSGFSFYEESVHGTMCRDQVRDQVGTKSPKCRQKLRRKKS